MRIQCVVYRMVAVIGKHGLYLFPSCRETVIGPPAGRCTHLAADHDILCRIIHIRIARLESVATLGAIITVNNDAPLCIVFEIGLPWSYDSTHTAVPVAASHFILGCQKHDRLPFFVLRKWRPSFFQYRAVPLAANTRLGFRMLAPLFRRRTFRSAPEVVIYTHLSVCHLFRPLCLNRLIFRLTPAISTINVPHTGACRVIFNRGYCACTSSWTCNLQIQGEAKLR